MAKQVINIGRTANDRSGDPLRTAFNKVNENFTELYTAITDGVNFAQVNADWNATTGVARILNKPTIPTNTNQLTNGSGFITAADIPDVVVTLNDLTDVDTVTNVPEAGYVLKWDGTKWTPGPDATLGSSGLNADTLEGQHGSYYLNYNNLTNRPTTLSHFTNDSGFITSTALTGYATESYVGTQVSNLINAAPTALNTLNELAAALGNDANFAATTATALGNRLRVDVSSQSLTTEQKSNAVTNLGLSAVATSGSYLDLSERPTKVSDLTNDTGFVTSAFTDSISFDQNNIYNNAGTELIISNNNYVSAEAETAYIVVPAADSTADLRIVQEQGNISLWSTAASTGSSFVFEGDKDGLTPTRSANLIIFAPSSSAATIASYATNNVMPAGWSIRFGDGTSQALTHFYVYNGNYNAQWANTINMSWPMTITSPDYSEGGMAQIIINANTSSWTFDSSGNLQLPAGGDIIDSNGVSVLGGSGADLGLLKISGSTIGTKDFPDTGGWGGYSLNLDPGGESFSYIQIPSVEGQTLGATLVIANNNTGNGGIRLSVQGGELIFTDTGIDLPYNLPVRQNNSWTKVSTPSISGGVGIVVWSSTVDYISSAKLIIQVEGDEVGDSSGWHSQACEAIISCRGYANTYGGPGGDPQMVVYGVVHTSVDPLVTFTVQRNPTTKLVEIVATPTAASSGSAALRIHSVEMSTRD